MAAPSVFQPRSVSWLLAQPLFLRGYHPERVPSGWCQEWRCPQLTAFEPFSQGVAEDAVPPLLQGELLRSFLDVAKKGSRLGKRFGGPKGFAVRRRELQGDLAGMTGLPRDGMEEERPAGDGLHVGGGLD